MLVQIVYTFIKRAFSDILWGKPETEDILLKAIQDAFRLPQLDKPAMRGLYARYFGIKTKKEKRSEVAKISTMLLEACYIRVLFERDEGKKEMLFSTDELKQHFPFLADGPSFDELKLLLAFSNALKVSLVLIDPYRNRDKLWELASRLENSGNEYHRGSGQRKEVDWREKIFEKLLEGTKGEKIPRDNQYTLKKKRKLEEQANAATVSATVAYHPPAGQQIKYRRVAVGDESTDSDDSCSLASAPQQLAQNSNSWMPQGVQQTGPFFGSSTASALELHPNELCDYADMLQGLLESAPESCEGHIDLSGMHAAPFSLQ